MTLNIKRTAKETIIKVGGRLDSFTAPVLEKMINKSALSAHIIVLELSDLEYISDSGIRVLLDAHKRIEMTGTLKLKGVSADVMDTFKTSGCAEVLAIN